MKALNFFDILTENGLIDLGLAFESEIKKTEILDKLAQLEAKLLQVDNSGMVDEHRALVESDVATKLRDVEDLVLPLLYNLQKNPEKEYIHWPNRTAIIDKQIEKIKAVTRYYERIK